MSYESPLGEESAPEQSTRVSITISDDLRRSRLTVFFRLLLALPHLIWLSLWGAVASLAVVANWASTLILGRPPRALHGFLSAYVRYVTHVSAYLFLAGNPFPGFAGEQGYPVEAHIPPAGRQSRWSVLFRGLLALPAVLLAAALSASGARTFGAGYGVSLLIVAAFLGWFAALATGRMPRGLRDAIAYALSYSAQLDAYLFLLTDRYPSSDPLTAIGQLPARSEPISLQVNDSLRRNRLTVFFRLLLSLPHLLWLELWTLLAFLAAIVNWIVTLILGRSPQALHRFLAAYLRYRTHVYAYISLVGGPFPGFTGSEAGYPIVLSVSAPVAQSRIKTLLRLPLALPAMMISSAYSGLLYLVAFLGWFASLVTGRMPLGLRNLGALALRYGAQVDGYLLLLTDVYPYSGPVASAETKSAPEDSDPLVPDSDFAQPVL